MRRWGLLSRRDKKLFVARDIKVMTNEWSGSIWTEQAQAKVGSERVGGVVEVLGFRVACRVPGVSRAPNVLVAEYSNIPSCFVMVCCQDVWVIDYPRARLPPKHSRGKEKQTSKAELKYKV